ncbi:MAG: endonuclease/exonuclease/phosphatase family protein [Natrialbaceae archaeon]|nr:endonuclease/exonuclease/phosphatase family protein [Natrialbaceae archaeon]
MKLLSCNAGYLLGYETMLGGYLPSPVGALVGDPAVEEASLERLVDIITTETPDVVTLLEVDRGSYRTATEGQVAAITDALNDQGVDYEPLMANKYGDGVVGSLPFFGQLGNAVLTRTDRPIRTHYLSAGRKRLVFEIDLPDATCFAVHLSLGARTRRRQFAELADLIAETSGDVIVTGDFNTFDGTGPLEKFADETGLERRCPGESVPERPLDDYLIDSRYLDQFFCSPSLPVDRCQALDVQLSDHRPIVLETAR